MDVAFSPDGAKIATASFDTTARLWDAATGKPLGTPMKHDMLVNGVAFNADGTKIAVKGQDKTVWLWNVVTGRPLGRAMTHSQIG